MILSDFDTDYLIFMDVTPLDRKTKVINVISRRGGDVLGTIKWYGPWRQYVLQPPCGTTWNPECLDTVNLVIRGLMAERKTVTIANDPAPSFSVTKAAEHSYGHHVTRDLGCATCWTVAHVDELSQ